MDSTNEKIIFPHLSLTHILLISQISEYFSSNSDKRHAEKQK